MIWENCKKLRWRLLKEELDNLGWRWLEFASRAKGDARKVRIAERLRAETAVTLKWIAKELHMGDWTHVANRLHKAKGNDYAGNQDQFKLVQKLPTAPTLL